jgi:hypothetical protein
MSEIALRYFLGLAFAIFAVAVSDSVFALLPAAVSVIMLGSLLLDIWGGKIDV